eukprot:GHUV01021221.1.p1 GENE.GHUV01021221.1~~GHUV01021221.1.p1  ORF type:complete len:123 (-),score=35.14 GHUV01021221.1:1512-1880(-)
MAVICTCGWTIRTLMVLWSLRQPGVVTQERFAYTTASVQTACVAYPHHPLCRCWPAVLVWYVLRYNIENKETKSADDEARIKTLYKQFGMWHGISSLNNLVVLAATVAYGWSLAGRLALHLA